MSLIDKYETFQEFLDSVQYTKSGIKRYEWIYGESYLSTGGAKTTEEILPLLELKPGRKVLDVGCGLGGHDFVMVEKYGALVDAIDLSENMMDVALAHLSKKSTDIRNKINFRICDVTTARFENNHYDAIYSRDTFLHIQHKPELFAQFFKWLKPGGKIVFTDYTRGKGNLSDEFQKYIQQRNYYLYTIEEYRNMMENAGFVNITAKDVTNKFKSTLSSELEKLCSNSEEFLKLFQQKDYDDLYKGWLFKLSRAFYGYQTWGLFTATKPL